MADRRPGHGHGDVCRYSPWTAPFFDNFFRKLLQDPVKITGPYIRPGMTAMDIGCGPGFFTLAMARMAGPEGKVIAIDMQQEMLDLVKKKSDRLFREVSGLLEDSGRYLIVEPTGHVFEEVFEDTLRHAERAGFVIEERPKVRFSRAAVLKTG